MISCLIVNFNCLFHTKNLIEDLNRQTFKDFEVHVVDQNSVEKGTVEFLNSLEKSNIKVTRNKFNRPLNHIWNDFALESKYEYLSFLNNDIRIPSNFLEDTHTIFQSEINVSTVIHPTNHQDHRIATPGCTEYSILPDRTRQGWDFSFRKTDWCAIPLALEFYCGDDYIFEKVYQNNKQVAMALSSPIIHLLGQTRKSIYNPVIPNRNPIKDIETYKLLGYKHYLNVLDKYSKINPEISKIEEILHHDSNNLCN